GDELAVGEVNLLQIAGYARPHLDRFDGPDAAGVLVPVGHLPDHGPAGRDGGNGRLLLIRTAGLNAGGPRAGKKELLSPVELALNPASIGRIISWRAGRAWRLLGSKGRRN